MLCIQETKVKDGDSSVIRGNQLLCFESNSKHYGCGFVINKRLSNSNDLSRLESSTYCLKTFKDIENLKKIAEQRDHWKILCTRIQKAAEV